MVLRGRFKKASRRINIIFPKTFGMQGVYKLLEGVSFGFIFAEISVEAQQLESLLYVNETPF